MSEELSAALIADYINKKDDILHALLAQAPACMAVKDLEGRYLFVNDQYERFFHISSDGIVGKYDYELFEQSVAEAFVAADKSVLEEGKTQYIEEQAPVDGVLHDFLTIKFPIPDQAGEVIAVGLIATDITERKKIENELQLTKTALEMSNEELREAMNRLEQIAVVDQLTGAWNRHKFEQVVAAEMTRFTRYNTSVSLLLFDLDNFKPVNDEYGHDAGDRVLKELVQRINQNIRKLDYLFRWGGDEFIVLLPSTPAVLAWNTAQKLKESIAGKPFQGQHEISASFSVSTLHEGESVQSWLKRADQGLYRAKSDAGEHIHCCD